MNTKPLSDNSLRNYLYRGTSVDKHKKGEGLKSRKISDFIEIPKSDLGMKLDEGYTSEASEINSIIMHQKDSSKYETSGLSTTPVYERALFYATKGGTRKEGIIYKICRKTLEDQGFTTYNVNSIDIEGFDPQVKEDNEVIIVLDSNEKADKISKLIADIIEIP